MHFDTTGTQRSFVHSTTMSSLYRVPAAFAPRDSEPARRGARRPCCQEPWWQYINLLYLTRDKNYEANPFFRCYLTIIFRMTGSIINSYRSVRSFVRSLPTLWMIWFCWKSAQVAHGQRYEAINFWGQNSEGRRSRSHDAEADFSVVWPWPLTLWPQKLIAGLAETSFSTPSDE